MMQIGKYKVLREIGSGSFGVVYLAEDPDLALNVAIKLFRIKDPAITTEAVAALKQRFVEEARRLRALPANPHIISLLEFGRTEDDTPYAVMPFIGQTLVDDIGQDVFQKTRLEQLDIALHPRAIPVTKAVDYLLQILQGLVVVHQAGLVHRDIKPSNILLERKGSLVTLVLCDFGIATTVFGTDVEAGSPFYVCPEQTPVLPNYPESHKTPAPARDVFSVGVLAYRMLTGTLPDLALLQAPDKLVPGLSAELSQLVLAALAVDPVARPRDAGEFLQRLSAVKEVRERAAFDHDHSTDTWVGDAGKAAFEPRLAPLYETIKQALLRQGELSGEDRETLLAMAAVIDLDAQELEQLIRQIEQDQAPSIRPVQNLLQLIELRIREQVSAESPALNAATRQALWLAAQKLNWSEAELEAVIAQRINVWRQHSPKAINRPATLSRRALITAVLGLLALLAVLFWPLLVGWMAERAADSGTDSASNQAHSANQNDPVMMAQSQLMQLGYRVRQNGQLDEPTTEAIRLFERASNLTETGAVDATLLHALSQALSDAEAHRKQEAAAQLLRAVDVERVKAVQGELKRIGYALEPSGEVDLHTRAALRNYQRGARLAASEQISDTLLAHLKTARTKPLPKPGESFKDCATCPEMVVIAAGAFEMGSTQGEAHEQPVRIVSFKRPFALGRYELTWDEYQVCIDAGACSGLGDQGWGKGRRPVIQVSWDDAQHYIDWLNRTHAETYRLPSEAEWEYAARAGSQAHYGWGSGISHEQANYGADVCCDGRIDGRDVWRHTSPVGAFDASALGLHDLHGNVAEWTQDCWNDTYKHAPTDGSAWLSGDCSIRVLRGGSWEDSPNLLRAAVRNWDGHAVRSATVGFRLAKDF